MGLLFEDMSSLSNEQKAFRNYVFLGSVKNYFGYVLISMMQYSISIINSCDHGSCSPENVGWKMNINAIIVILIIIFSIYRNYLWNKKKIYMDSSLCNEIIIDTRFEKYLFVYFNKRSVIKVIHIVTPLLLYCAVAAYFVDDIKKNGLLNFANSANGGGGVFLLVSAGFMIVIIYWALRAMVYLPHEDESKNEG